MNREQEYPPNSGQSEDSEDQAPLDLDEERLASPDAGGEEISELNERILRLAAELENTRRRAERERIEAGRYAIAAFARDLLAVADNFERALAAAPDEEQGSETVSGFVDGLRMTERALLAALERHGVRKIEPRGEKFDPNLHQAVAQAPAPGVPPGHVAEVAQPGFVIGERVLRAAMVVVSTGEATAPGETVDTSV